MKFSHSKLVSGTVWTVVAFAASQIIRMAGSVISARLLSPDIFGVMMIVYSLRAGIDLLSDVGIQQSVVSNKNAELPDFYNTAWTVRLSRSLLLWVVCLVAAWPLAAIYHTPAIALVLPIAGLYFVLAGLSSLSPTFLQKKMMTARLSVFGLSVEMLSTLGQVLFALFFPSVWALVFGSLLYAGLTAAGSYLIMPELRHKFIVIPEHAKQILSFGKWIFVASLIYFFSANFDRLYLGNVFSLQLLGIFAVSRNLTEMINNLFARLNFIVIFPFIAQHAESPRLGLRSQLNPIRALFLLVVAVGLSIFVAGSDLLVAMLYDHRYQPAGWMTSILAMGVWISILCTINESSLLGFGKPLYSAVANALKFGWLLVVLPIAAKNSVPIVIGVVAAGDLLRYLPILFGQRKENFSFLSQDLALTICFCGLVAIWEFFRYRYGFGISFEVSANPSS